MVSGALVEMPRRARDRLGDWMSGHHRHVTPVGALAAIVIGAVLAGAALAGDGWVAGFATVRDLIVDAAWQYLPVAIGFVALSHVAYSLAYREVLHREGGPPMSRRHVGASVLAGFGMLTPRAGFSLDRAVCQEQGMSADDARDRVLTLGMLEYALLAPAAFVCATVLLIQNFPARGGVVLSWVVGVPVGTVVFMLLMRHRDRLPRNGWVWRGLRSALDAVSAMLRVVSTSRAGLLAIVGMAAYWAADIAALGACLAVVRHTVPVAVLVVGYASGYAFTRRSMPLAGAGAAEALMPFAMHWMTVPLAAAVAGVFAYRMCNLWLPLGPAALSLRHLRGRPLISAA
jgi:uncharacterized membrane protein YbhN (UPF0104 family)